MKKQLEHYEKKEKHKNREKFESFDVFMKLIRNISNINLNISESIVILSSIISKKLSNSFILIDKKDFNIKN